MLSGILDRETAYVKPVEAIHRAAAVLVAKKRSIRTPIVPPLTQQGEPAEYDPSDPAPTAQQRPRVIPSRDVPDMAVVGKPKSRLMRFDSQKVTRIHR